MVVGLALQGRAGPTYNLRQMSITKLLMLKLCVLHFERVWLEGVFLVYNPAEV